MSKVPGRLAMEQVGTLDAECVKEAGQCDATDGVDRVGADGEPCLADRCSVHLGKAQHHLHVGIGVVLVLHMSQVIHLGEGEVLRISHPIDLPSLSIGEEGALVIEELQGIPVLRVVARRDDDAGIGTLLGDGKLCRRGGGETDIDHIKADCL